MVHEWELIILQFKVKVCKVLFGEDIAACIRRFNCQYNNYLQHFIQYSVILPEQLNISEVY